MDSTIIAGIIVSIGPTMAGLAAWNASRQNASQKSVDDLSVQFVDHAALDELRFKEVHEAILASTTDVASEAARVAAILAIVTKQTAKDLATASR